MDDMLDIFIGAPGIAEAMSPDREDTMSISEAGKEAIREKLRDKQKELKQLQEKERKLRLLLSRVGEEIVKLEKDLGDQ